MAKKFCFANTTTTTMPCPIYVPMLNSLEGGFIRNGCITCPYHGAEFDLRDGYVKAPPAFEAIKTYPVKTYQDTISICAMPITDNL